MIPPPPVPSEAPSRTLYRPVGLFELRLMLENDLRGFPPRLPEQPIFYPVIYYDYAVHIARQWNTDDPKSGYAGFVTAFAVEQPYVDQFEEHQVGGSVHRELWVPAAELDTFNQHIIGRIQLKAAYYGESYQAAAAVDLLVRLHESFQRSTRDLSALMGEQRDAVFINFPFWRQRHFDEQLERAQKFHLLRAIAALWAIKYPDMPLLTSNPTVC